jgi:cyd operon protein YbgT
MWYFSWVLGVLLACAFGIINLLWLEAQENLDQDSSVLDPLTKLITRVEFLEVLEETIERCKSSGSPFSLLLVSLDAFRSILQREGDEAANEAVLSVADIIKRETRRDIDAVSRYDAQTFAIILPGAHTPAAETIARRIRNQATERLGAKTAESAVSIGIAEYPKHSCPEGACTAQDEVEALLRATDGTLKRAQEQSGGVLSYA